MLSVIAQDWNPTRFDLCALDVHDQPTIDKRLAYLERKTLILPLAKAHHHEAGGYRASTQGRTLYRLLGGAECHDRLKRALDSACDLPIERREAPINVGHLQVLHHIVGQPLVSTTDLLPLVDHQKQTLRSRLACLIDKGLISRTPKFNAGGNGSVNRYQPKALGDRLIRELIA